VLFHPPQRKLTQYHLTLEAVRTLPTPWLPYECCQHTPVFIAYPLSSWVKKAVKKHELSSRPAPPFPPLISQHRPHLRSRNIPPHYLFRNTVKFPSKAPVTPHACLPPLISNTALVFTGARGSGMGKRGVKRYGYLGHPHQWYPAWGCLWVGT